MDSAAAEFLVLGCFTELMLSPSICFILFSMRSWGLDLREPLTAPQSPDATVGTSMARHGLHGYMPRWDNMHPGAPHKGWSRALK